MTMIDTADSTGFDLLADIASADEHTIREVLIELVVGDDDARRVLREALDTVDAHHPHRAVAELMSENAAEDGVGSLIELIQKALAR
jgi:hypothetical protein